MHGNELKVYRSLPEGEWITFNAKGVLQASDNAGI